jgi:hypothetical protein
MRKRKKRARPVWERAYGGGHYCLSNDGDHLADVVLLRAMSARPGWWQASIGSLYTHTKTLRDGKRWVERTRQRRGR